MYISLINNNQIKKVIRLLGIIIIASCESQYSIKNKLISFNSTRADLTLDYLNYHYGIRKKHPTLTPKLIVLHWTAIPKLQESFAKFDTPTLDSTRPDLSDASNLNVSSHYLVDRNGDIFQLMPDTIMARHIIGLNHCAIGIENVGGTAGYELTQEQVKSNIYLIKELTKKYNIKYVIGHYEYGFFKEKKHPLWLEKDSTYFTYKIDPGPEFMKAVREGIDSKYLPDF